MIAIAAPNVPRPGGDFALFTGRMPRLQRQCARCGATFPARSVLPPAFAQIVAGNRPSFAGVIRLFELVPPTEADLERWLWWRIPPDRLNGRDLRLNRNDGA